MSSHWCLSVIPLNDVVLINLRHPADTFTQAWQQFMVRTAAGLLPALKTDCARSCVVWAQRSVRIACHRAGNHAPFSSGAPHAGVGWDWRRAWSCHHTRHTHTWPTTESNASAAGHVTAHYSTMGTYYSDIPILTCCIQTKAWKLHKLHNLETVMETTDLCSQTIMKMNMVKITRVMLNAMKPSAALDW